MSTPRKFNNEVEVREYLETIHGDALLENSPLIYALENTSKTTELLNKIRFDESITLEQLLRELKKVHSLKHVKMGIVTETSYTDSTEGDHFYDVSDIDSVKRYVKRAGNVSVIKRSDVLGDVAMSLGRAICKSNPIEFDSFNDTIEYLSSQMKDPTTQSEDIDSINKIWDDLTSEQGVVAQINGDDLERARYDKMVNVGNLIDIIHAIDSDNDEMEDLCDIADITDGFNELSSNMFESVILNTVRRRTSMKCVVTEHMIQSLESQLFNDYSDITYNKPILEELTSDEARSIISYEYKRDKITPKGICKMIQLTCDPCSPFKSNDQINSIKDCLKDKCLNTLDYEIKSKEYCDIPIAHAMSYCKDFMKDVYRGLDDIEKSIDNTFDEIESCLNDKLEDYLREDAIAAQFNPNPFNVYKLTPFPVGTRTLQRTLTDIASANSDEELDKAMLEYARLENAYNHSVGVTEGKNDSPVDKGLRSVARASANAVNGGLRGMARAADNTKTSAKKIVDPMEKFIEDTLNKIKKSDQDERRNYIIKGGVVSRVGRFIRRGIGIVILGQFGTVGIILAGIRLLTVIATDSYLDQKERHKILRELEDELKIVEEKIEDSRGDENKQKKYELMRIRNQLKNDIDRITLRLKY